MSVMAGVFGSNGYDIREEDSYEEAVLMCGGHESIDDALAVVDEALNRNPSGFQKLNGDSDIHFAKTKLRIAKGSVVPALTLFFTINEEHRVVTKLHVKLSSPESMAFSDDPWDLDDPPF